MNSNQPPSHDGPMTVRCLARNEKSLWAKPCRTRPGRQMCRQVPRFRSRRDGTRTTWQHLRGGLNRKIKFVGESSSVHLRHRAISLLSIRLSRSVLLISKAGSALDSAIAPIGFRHVIAGRLALLARPSLNVFMRAALSAPRHKRHRGIRRPEQTLEPERRFSSHVTGDYAVDKRETKVSMPMKIT